MQKQKSKEDNLTCVSTIEKNDFLIYKLIKIKYNNMSLKLHTFLAFKHIEKDGSVWYLKRRHEEKSLSSVSYEQVEDALSPMLSQFMSSRS